MGELNQQKDVAGTRAVGTERSQHHRIGAYLIPKGQYVTRRTQTHTHTNTVPTLTPPKPSQKNEKKITRFLSFTYSKTDEKVKRGCLPTTNFRVQRIFITMHFFKKGNHFGYIRTEAPLSLAVSSSKESVREHCPSQLIPRRMKGG